MDRAIAKKLSMFHVIDRMQPGISGMFAGSIEPRYWKEDVYPKFHESLGMCSAMERHFTESEWREYLGFINSNSKYPDPTTAIRRASPLELCEAACGVWFREMFE